jgi:transcriptional regulator, RpiR family
MLDRIKASLSSLAPAEQRVGKLVLADPRAFANLPVSELAERAHVSKPTVIRFCRSVGYDGLSDFKLKLAGSVSEGVPFIHHSVDADDKTADVLVKVIDNTVAAFLKYRGGQQRRHRKGGGRARRHLPHRPRIEFFGVGNSASWRRTRSTSSFAWAAARSPTATATCKS